MHENIEHHMEVRGLGVINILDLYGVASVRPYKRLDLVVQLRPWKDFEPTDRLGTRRLEEVILDIAVPKVQIPVSPGRNITSIIEVAARNHMLRRQGVDSALQFEQMLASTYRRQRCRRIRCVTAVSPLLGRGACWQLLLSWLCLARGAMMAATRRTWPNSEPAPQPPSWQRPASGGAPTCLSTVSVTDTTGALPPDAGSDRVFCFVRTADPGPGRVSFYDVNAELWTDGAEKFRFVALRPGATMLPGPEGIAAFPPGGVLIKSFAYDLAGDGSSQTQLAEMRFMLATEQGWRFFSYRVDTTGATDAAASPLVRQELVTTELTAVVDGKAQDVAHLYPRSQECGYCHSEITTGPLGYRSQQLDIDVTYDDGVGDQLELLRQTGLYADGVTPPSLALWVDPFSRSVVHRRGCTCLHGCQLCALPSTWWPDPAQHSTSIFVQRQRWLKHDCVTRCSFWRHKGRCVLLRVTPMRRGCWTGWNEPTTNRCRRWAYRSSTPMVSNCCAPGSARWSSCP